MEATQEMTSYCWSSPRPMVCGGEEEEEGEVAGRDLHGLEDLLPVGPVVHAVHVGVRTDMLGVREVPLPCLSPGQVGVVLDVRDPVSLPGARVSTQAQLVEDVEVPLPGVLRQGSQNKSLQPSST